MKNFKELLIWKIAFKISKEVYFLTKKFPKEELYGLTSQIRRSAISIPSNIAEGCGRNTQKEFLQFLYNAFGSLKELECQLILAKEFKFISESDYLSLQELCESLSKIMAGLMIKIKKEI